MVQQTSWCPFCGSDDIAEGANGEAFCYACRKPFRWYDEPWWEMSEEEVPHGE